MVSFSLIRKIERGGHKAKRSEIPILAKLFEIDEKELLTIWLADKVLYAMTGGSRYNVISA